MQVIQQVCAWGLQILPGYLTTSLTKSLEQYSSSLARLKELGLNKSSDSEETLQAPHRGRRLYTVHL